MENILIVYSDPIYGKIIKLIVCIVIVWIIAKLIKRYLTSLIKENESQYKTNKVISALVI